MGGNSTQTRRTILATIGVGVLTGTVSSRGPSNEDEGELIELVGVAWTIDSLGTPEVEVTIRNDTGEELSLDVTVRIFEDDTLLDDVNLLFSDVPDGIETSEDSPLLDVEQADLDFVTHWEIEISEFDLLNGDETVYVFDGPVTLDEEIDVEDAEVEENE